MSEIPKPNPDAEIHNRVEAADRSKDRERTHLASEWAEAADGVAQITGNARAKELVNDYLKNSAVGQETPIGVRKVGSSGTKDPKAVLVPVMFDDKEVNKATRAALEEKGQIASYWEGRPGFITFDGENQISQTWKGLVLLHELVHADSHEKSFRRGEDYKEAGWWEEEFEAFSFEHDLIAELGGEAYEGFLEAKVQEILAAMEDEENVPWIGDIQEIEEIFGESLSIKELSTRKTAIWIGAVYRAYDEKYGVESHLKKVAFTRSIYGAETKEQIRPSILFHASQNRDIQIFEPRNEKSRDPLEGPKVFATPDKALASCFLVPTDDSWVKIGRFEKDGVPGPWKVVVNDEQRFKKLDRGGSIYSLPSESFSTDPVKGMGESEWTSSEAVTPTNKDDYESGLLAMQEQGVDVLFVDEETFRAIQSADDHGERIIEALQS